MADLNSVIIFVLFSQEKPLRWEEIKTHIHTRARPGLPSKDIWRKLNLKSICDWFLSTNFKYLFRKFSEQIIQTSQLAYDVSNSLHEL